MTSASVLSDRETGRSRGFGFVEMMHDDEALSAIESLDGQDFDGRRLTVNEARPRTPGGGEGGGGGGGGYRGGGAEGGGGGGYRRGWRRTAEAADTETTTEQLLSRIESVLDEQVRPQLRADGGDVVVIGLDQDNILQVRLTGACQGCSSSVFTLTMRVESTLKAQVPEIRFVEAVP